MIPSRISEKRLASMRPCGSSPTPEATRGPRARVRPADDRPLIREQGDLERLHREREPLYREFAAHVVDASGPVDEVAEAIEKELLRWSG